MGKRTQIAGFLLAAAAGLVLVSPPASAQGLFEALFGGFRRAARDVPSEVVSSFADPFGGMREARPRGDSGSASTGYCVRTCDGHYFPVRAQGGVSTADMCRSFCPATETKVYSGGAIDYAVTRDGSSYNDLPNAFLYRKKVVDSCTCNGKTPYGLATIDVKSDPTLRQGDFVATKAGLTAFTGMNNKTAEFTPIENVRALSKDVRSKLSETRIMAPNPGAPVMTPVTLSGRRSTESQRRAANER